MDATSVPCKHDREGPAHLILQRRWAFLLLLLLAGVSPASGDWIREFRGEVSYDDTLSNSNRSADQRDDFSFAGRARFGRFGELTDNLRLSVSADLDARAFARYDDFNSLTLSSTVGLRYRFGLGARAPFVCLEASGGYAVFNQSLQSGGRYRTGIVFGKRMSERLVFNASYFFEDIRGDIPLFDRCSHAFALAASFDLTARTQLSAGYELREGQVISYAVPPRPDIVAIANDRRMVNTFGTPYVAYNLDATSHALSFGVNQALTAAVSLSLRNEWQHTGARKFPTSIMSSGFLSMLPFDLEIRRFVRSLRCWFALFLLLSIATARAGSVAVAVKDERGRPIKDAVVYALPISAAAPSRKARAEVVQRNKQFVPYVSAFASTTHLPGSSAFSPSRM